MSGRTVMRISGALDVSRVRDNCFVHFYCHLLLVGLLQNRIVSAIGNPDLRREYRFPGKKA
jgi:hypothetical protein